MVPLHDGEGYPAPISDQPHPNPPGWYPDPSAPGTVRWWDGSAWSAHTARAAGGPGSAGTDGFAIAALVLGIIGGSVLAIVFGFVARHRIERSGGVKGGRGMATAGIVLGSIWLTLIVVLVVLGVTGVLESENADDYSGRERQVATVVDRFEDAADDDEAGAARICDDLLTPDAARLISRGGGKPCAEYFADAMDGQFQVEIDVKSIDISGTQATVKVDEGGTGETWTLVEGPPGTWRISDLR